MELSVLFWIIFAVVILSFLAVDLGIFHRKARVVSTTEALMWTVVWIVLSLGFSGMIYFYSGREQALAFLTGYILEQSLSIDNIFVFYLIFSFYKLPPSLEHRVLFWGVVGAIVLRAVFIVSGTAIIEEFHWVIYILSVLLVYDGMKMVIARNENV